MSSSKTHKARKMSSISSFLPNERKNKDGRVKVNQTREMIRDFNNVVFLELDGRVGTGRVEEK